jgi:hypothetical protein
LYIYIKARTHSNGFICDVIWDSSGKANQQAWLSGIAEQAEKQEGQDFDQQTLFRKSGDPLAGPSNSLPPNAVRRSTALYDEIFIPAVRATPPPGERLIPIADFDDWAQLAFTGVTQLRRLSGWIVLRALSSGVGFNAIHCGFNNFFFCLEAAPNRIQSKVFQTARRLVTLWA